MRGEVCKARTGSDSPWVKGRLAKDKKETENI